MEGSEKADDIISEEILVLESTPLERAQAIRFLEAAEMALEQIRYTIDKLEKRPKPRRGLGEARKVEMEARERRSMACWHALGIGVTPPQVEAALKRGARSVVRW
ncbi:hypothetical protein WV31_19025 [Magnetospirillum sp. ME-1]|uniref:hypothetical protein n=1 Tax=Magnetospirillum sp. ME-1 TaxID=1639348 RepID=UPI000A17E474|nr:hypothetical protein [Magnetospirillum sp. ME-1]ARJ67597.1 hypothetical protein WV31_19025 [Magnetospirillum sp. ME-1]